MTVFNLSWFKGKILFYKAVHLSYNGQHLLVKYLPVYGVRLWGTVVNMNEGICFNVHFLVMQYYT